MQYRATTRRRRRAATLALLVTTLLLSPPPPSPRAAPRPQQQKAAAAETAAQRAQRDAVPAFVVTSLTGQTLKSADLPMRENWVLVYVRPDCGPCDSIFRALGDERMSRAVPRRGRPGGGFDLAEASRREEARARFARRDAAAKTGAPATDSVKTATATPGATTPSPAAAKPGAAGSSNVRQEAAKMGLQRGYFANVEDAPRKLIIVVGGASVKEVKEMAARMPWIPEGSWYADPSNEVAAKFKWVAAPVITGVSKSEVKWSYAGVPPQGLPLRSLMSSWHERREGSPQQPPSEPHP